MCKDGHEGARAHLSRDIDLWTPHLLGLDSSKVPTPGIACQTPVHPVRLLLRPAMHAEMSR